MLKIVALLALVAFACASLSQTIDGSTTTETTGLNGISAELQGLIQAGFEELVKAALVLDPTDAEKAALRAAALQSTEYQGLLALDNMDVNTIAGIRDSLTANITVARAAWEAYKAQVAANLTALLQGWKAALANATESRDTGLDNIRQSLIARATAIFYFHVAKIVQRTVAAQVLAFKVYGERVELGFRFLNATVFLLNNVIALKNNSNVGGEIITPVNVTLLKERMFELFIVVQVANWRLTKIGTFLQLVAVANAEALQEIRQRIQDFANQVRETVADLRARWAATAGLQTTLADRISAFLENVTGVTVVIGGLDGDKTTPITVTVTVTSDSTNPVNEVEAWLIKLVRAFLSAYAARQESDIATTAAPSAKRAPGTYSVVSTIASDEDSASGVAASMLAVAAAAAVALRA